MDKEHTGNCLCGKEATTRESAYCSNPRNITHIRDAVLQSPLQLAVRHVCALGISDQSVHRILHMDLHFLPYKQLIDQDKRIRMLNIIELLNILNDQVLNNLLMSDEANFHMCDYVNAQNSQYWAPGNPQELFE